MYYTVVGGVPSAADVTAAVADLNALYSACASDKRLVDCSEVTTELTVKNMQDIKTKMATQPYAPPSVPPPNNSAGSPGCCASISPRADPFLSSSLPHCFLLMPHCVALTYLCLCSDMTATSACVTSLICCFLIIGAAGMEESIDNVLDCFVSGSDGIRFIERSLWAHRSLMGDDSGGVWPTSTTAPLSTSRTDSVYEALPQVERYESRVLRQLVQRRAQPTQRANREGAASNVPSMEEQFNAILSKSDALAFDACDLLDKAANVVDDTVLSMTMAHAALSRPLVPVTVGAFVYVVARAMVRATFLRLPRDAILRAIAAADAEHDNHPRGDGRTTLVERLLYRAKMASLRWFVTVDVDSVGVVKWADITSALVEHCTARDLVEQRDDETVGVPQDGGAPPKASLHAAAVHMHRIATYDWYEHVAQPPRASKTLQQYPYAVSAVHMSPYLLLEGRGDRHGLVHADDLGTVRHVLPRHRADTTKITAASVVYAALIEAAVTTLVVAEVDMHIYLYDFGPKRRHRLVQLARVRAECAVVACCFVAHSCSLVTGDRTGALQAMKLQPIVSEALSKAAAEAAMLIESGGDAEPLEKPMAAVQTFYASPHQDAVTAVTLAAPSLLLSASIDGTIAVFRSTTWVAVRTFPAHTNGGVRSLVGDPRLSAFASHGFDGSTVVWHSAHGVNCTPLVEPLVPHQHRVDWLFLDTTAQQLLTLDVSGLVKVWDMHKFSNVTTFFAIGSMPPYLESIGGCEALNAAPGACMEIPFDLAPVQSAAFDVMHHRLLVRGFRNESMTRLVEGRRVLAAHRGASVRSIVLSPRHIVSFSSREMRIWQCPTLELVADVKADVAMMQGEAPPPLPHRAPNSVQVMDTNITRSDLLHLAIDPEGVSTGGYSARGGDAGGGKEKTIPAGGNRRIGMAHHGAPGLHPLAAPSVANSGSCAETCASCSYAHGTRAVAAFSDGTIRCHDASTGKCIKRFIAQRVVIGAAASPTAIPLSSSHAPRDASCGFVSSCGQSLDAVSCGYLEPERQFVVCYADGAIRYFNDRGASRVAVWCQVLPEVEDVIDRNSISTRKREPASSQAGQFSRAGSSSTLLRSSQLAAVDEFSELLSLESPQALSASPALFGITGGFTTIVQSVCSSTLRLCANAHSDGLVSLVDIGTSQPIVKRVHEVRLTSEVLVMQFLGPLPCLAIGDASRTLRVYPVRGAALISTCSDILQESNSIERRARAARAASVVRAPTLLSSVRKRSLFGPQPPSSGASLGGAAPMMCVSQTTLSAKPSCISYDASTHLIVVGLVDGRFQLMHAFNLAVALNLAVVASPSAAPRPPVSPQTVRELVVKITAASPSEHNLAHSDNNIFSVWPPSEHQSPFNGSLRPLHQLEESTGAGGGSNPETQLAEIATITMALCLITFFLNNNNNSASWDAALGATDAIERYAVATLSHLRAIVARQGAALTPTCVDHIAPLVCCLQTVATTLPQDARSSSPSPACIAPLTHIVHAAIVASSDASSEQPAAHGGAPGASPVTSIVRLCEGLILVGTALGDVLLCSLGSSGAIAKLNASTSLPSIVADHISEWRRMYRIASGVKKAFVLGGGSGSMPGTTPAASMKRLFDVGLTLAEWASCGVAADAFDLEISEQARTLFGSLPTNGAHSGTSPICGDVVDVLAKSLHGRLSTVLESFTVDPGVGDALHASTPTPRGAAVAEASVSPFRPKSPRAPALLAPQQLLRRGTAISADTQQKSPRAAGLSARSPRLSFLVAGEPPPLTTFAPVSPPPNETQLYEAYDGAEGSPAHDGPFGSSFGGAPKLVKVHPRVFFATSVGPKPYQRPSTAPSTNTEQQDVASHLVSPRRRIPRHPRVPRDVQMRYGIEGSAKLPIAATAVEVTRDMARTTLSTPSSLTDRCHRSTHYGGTDNKPVSIGFGLMLPPSS